MNARDRTTCNQPAYNRRVVRVLTILLCACVAAPASADQVDEYVRSQLKARRLPGVSLAVVRNGRILKAAGYGIANLELDVPATERTVYEIGSITKQITANAVLLLRDDGKLGLDDPLARYIENVPSAWEGITIRHVLTHTAGLPDFDTGDIGFSYRREYSPDEFVALLGSRPLAFRPGDRWAYTNAFPLLGLVIARVAGLSYEAFVRQRIFEPLGLRSARVKVAGNVVPYRAAGYLWKDGAFRQGEMLRPEVIAANGAIMMNVMDLARWDIAITSGRLLRAPTVAEMTTPSRLNDGSTVSHGLGWFMDTFNGHRFGAHWGTTVTGHSAVIRRYDEGITVIVLANLDDGGLAVDAMSKRIADMYLPGSAIQGLTPLPDPDPQETVRIRATLTAIGAGEAAAGATPGLGARLPPAVRERIRIATGPTVTRFDALGQERLTAFHFNLDPALKRVRWYRSTSPSGMRYVTVRLAGEGTILGVLVEDH